MFWQRSRPTLLLETDAARLVLFERGRAVRWGSIPLPEWTATPPDTLPPAEPIAAALRTLWAHHRAPTRGVIVASAWLPADTRLVPWSPDEPPPTEQAIAQRFWAGQAVRVGVHLLTRHAVPHLFAMASPQNMVAFIETVLDMAGLHMAALEPKPLALIRGIGAPHCFVLDVGRTMATFTFVQDALPLVSATWQLTAPLLRTHGARLTRLAEHIHTITQRVAATYGKEALACPTYVVGALATSGELHDLLTTVLGLSLAPLPDDTPFPTSLPPHLYMAAVGLARKRI
ncbi:type IV pilus biogenesis protein PilM [Ardenticatena maritima]|nr:hypothetical protein [Ardenticatena maritima]KPL87702.1 hypothetical protein SE16_08870 [Ardenticatena maritima]